jgi:chromosome segregation ATPase
VSDQPENKGAAKDEGVNPDPAAAVSEEEEDFAGVGTHVTSVLRAADAAAAQIRTEAKTQADEIRRKADAEAQAAAQKLKQDGERRRTESESEAGEIRRVAESYATQHRQEAEQQARQTLTDAEGQARATRQAAEEMAKQIEGSARERRDVLEGETRKLEVRLQRLLEGVRDLSSQLEGLVGPTNDREGQSDGSLAEVLQVPRRTDPAAS